MINELSVKNFKSWESIEKMRFAPITGLFGANSSGKTSILQLLLMLRQTTESSDRASVLNLGDERSLVQLGSYRDLVFNHDLNHAFQFKLDWMIPNALEVQDPSAPSRQLFRSNRLSVSAEIGHQKEKPVVNNLVYDFAGSQFIMSRKEGSYTKFKLQTNSDNFSFVRTVGRAWELPAPVKCYGFPDQVFSYFQNASFLGDLQFEFEQLFNRLFYLGPLREYPKRHYTWSGAEPADMGQRGESAIDAILAAGPKGPYISPGYRKKKKTLEQRVANWLKELGLIHSFTVQRISESSNLYEVRVRKSANSSEVLITDVGFGVSQILPVLALCYYVPEGSTLVLEQPEIHLHPRVQSGLADVFVDAMLNRGIQIVLESHSEHLLRRLQRRIAEEELSIDDVALYFCESSNSRSVISPLNMDIFGSISNWPRDFFGDDFGEMSAITTAAMRRKSEQSN